MATFDLSIDLGDGLGPVTATVGPKERAATAARIGARPPAPPSVPLTRVPVAVTSSYAPVFCAHCGGETREFRGLFLEERLSNGVRVLSRRTLRELTPFANLPRRFDRAPAEVVELCPECFMGEGAWREEIARVQVQAELPWDETEMMHRAEVVKERATALALVVDLGDEEPEPPRPDFPDLALDPQEDA